MPVRPGSIPVENVDHDTGVCAGTVGRNGRNVPAARSFAMLGSLPSFIHFSVYLASAPSKPRTMTFWPALATGERRKKTRTERRNVRRIKGADDSRHFSCNRLKGTE